VTIIISDIMNVIVTSKKAFRYQKLLKSRIDISTSDNLIIEIRN